MCGPKLMNSSLIKLGLFATALNMNAQNSLPVSAPVTTDLAGKTGAEAIQSVFRVVVPSKNSGGSGFLHKSGWVITAAHVVGTAAPAEIFIVLSDSTAIPVVTVATDAEIDVAILKPRAPIVRKALTITSKTSIPVGTQVTTWGFPEGYFGPSPLLTVGYVAGVDQVSVSPARTVARFVINAAFNRGNSGGPVLNLEDGAVVGLVSSKLAPIPNEIVSALNALEANQSGFQYSATRHDGTTINFSEGQVIAAVLQHLRAQTQLVIGHSVATSDLVAFLRKNKIEP
jgi:S1-C subfamily serine protease